MPDSSIELKETFISSMARITAILPEEDASALSAAFSVTLDDYFLITESEMFKDVVAKEKEELQLLDWETRLDKVLETKAKLGLLSSLDNPEASVKDKVSASKAALDSLKKDAFAGGGIQVSLDPSVLQSLLSVAHRPQTLSYADTFHG